MTALNVALLLALLPAAAGFDLGTRAAEDCALARFLAQHEPAPRRVVALRHMVGTTRGGTMSGWVDACTVLEGDELRYWIVAEGGSSAVRKHALVGELDSERAARRRGDPARAALSPDNYEFTSGEEVNGTTRVKIVPRRKEAMLVDGTAVLDAATGDLLSVEGRLAKSPSFWTRHPQGTA